LRAGRWWAIALMLVVDSYMALAILAATFTSLPTGRLRAACPVLALTILSTVWLVLRRRGVSVGVLVPGLALFLLGMRWVTGAALAPGEAFFLPHGAALGVVAALVYAAARSIVGRWHADPKLVMLWGGLGMASSLIYHLWIGWGLEAMACFVVAAGIILLPAVRSRLVGSGAATPVEEKR
jgi:hypothetical protein